MTTVSHPRSLLDTMLVRATTAHAGQFDKGGQPYILHPLAVMYLCESDDEELLCIALGHDIIEDTDITYADLRADGMPDRVIEGIRALTKLPGETVDEYKIRVCANPDAVVVKMADLTHNSDIRRLKGVRQKDLDRMASYHRFYLELRQHREHAASTPEHATGCQRGWDGCSCGADTDTPKPRTKTSVRDLCDPAWHP